jgi:hypothetical protein
MLYYVASNIVSVFVYRSNKVIWCYCSLFLHYCNLYCVETEMYCSVQTYNIYSTIKVEGCHNRMVVIPPLPEGGGGYTVLPLSVRPSVQDIFRRIFLSNCWWQKSDIWSQSSYRYTILWVAFLDPSDSYFLFADLVDFYTHWTYMHIFRHIFLSNYWWQKSDIWSQALYRYPISWEAFCDLSDSSFLKSGGIISELVHIVWFTSTFAISAYHH